MRIYKIILVIIVCCAGNLQAQQDLLNKKNFFTSDTVLSVAISSDFSHLVSQALKDTSIEEWQPASVRFIIGETNVECKDAEIRARGKYRKEACYPPPVMVRFNHKNLPGRLKLVWPCKTTSSLYEQYVLKEYLVYKMYNLVTEKSFKVRLVKVSFTDTKNKIKSDQRFGFFIEDIDQVAKRNECIEMQEDSMLHTESVQRRQMTELAIFQFMVGNTDWNVPVKRNLKFLLCNISGNPIAVPYDFDYTGMVNAKYAIPAETLPIISVRERYYLGFTRTLDELRNAVEGFRTKKDSLIKLVNEQPGLDNFNKREMIKYLNEFFEDVDSDRKLEEFFIKKAKRG
ncbi:MAG: hypothetical protein ACXWV5_05455 [Flavitalea sp.]